MLKKISLMVLMLCLLPKNTNGMNLDAKKVLACAAAGAVSYMLISKCYQWWQIRFARAELANDPWALHKACGAGDLAKVKLLIAAGACIEAQTNAGATPLDVAIHHDRLPVIELLAQQKDAVNACGNDGNTPLHKAVMACNIPAAQILLTYGADRNARGQYGNTPLHQALLQAQLYRTLLPAQFKKPKYTEMIRYLLDQGVEMNAVNDSGKSPLDCAALAGDGELVKLLMNYGVCLDVKVDQVTTPFHMAAYNRNYEACRSLISESFFNPGWQLPDEKERLNHAVPSSLGILCLASLQKHDYEALKKNILKLQDWSAACVADQVSLDHQKEIIKAWQQENSQFSKEQLASLMNAHCERHLTCIKKVLMLKNKKQQTARDIARAQNNRATAKYLEVIENTPQFHMLNSTLQADIIRNIASKLDINSTHSTLIDHLIEK